MATAAWLAAVDWSDGSRGHLLAFVGARPGSEEPLAAGINAAVALSGSDGVRLDVTFLGEGDPVLERIARVALRFAARRAAKTGDAIEILATIARAEFTPFGGVQATMEEEAQLRARALVAAATGEIFEEAGIQPSITVRQGETVAIVRALLAERNDIAALVLGAAAEGAPGPLIATFTGAEAGQLPCPVMIVPGNLSSEAIDRLS